MRGEIIRQIINLSTCMAAQNDKQSFFEEADEDDDLQPHQLSGDESAERSVLVSDIAGTKANFLLTVTTIMKTVIGAGILSLPLTISRLGYILGIIVFAIVIIIVQFTCLLLLKAKNLSKHSNYSSISYHIFRNKFSQIACSSAILVNNLGICIVELTIFKGSLKKILDSYIDDQSVRDAFYVSPWFIVVVLAILEIPFTLVKKIEKLKFMAFLGVAGITVFVIALIINFFLEMAEPARNWTCHPDMVPIADDVLEMAAVIPNLMLALAYQMNFFPIFKGLKDSRDEKMAKASITGILGCAFFYILVGNIGYCLYGTHVKGNFLLSFDRGDINEGLYILLNGGFLISVFFSFPVMFFGARNNFIAITKNVIMIIRKVREEYRVVSNDTVEEISSYIQTDDRAARKKKAQLLFYVYTLVLYLIAIGIAIAVDDIEDVFNLVGAIASNAIAFIFPSMFYVFLVKRKEKKIRPQFYAAFACFCFFIPFGVFAVVSKFLVSEEE